MEKSVNHDAEVTLVTEFSVCTSKPLLIIIIVSLFQEDNIFGMNASLTYGPRKQRWK